MRGRWCLAVLLLLAGGPASAQLVGECPPGQVAITQDGVWKGCGVLDLPGADFTCTPTGVGLSCALNTAVSHLGSCIGEQPDHCTTDDLRGIDVLQSVSTFDEGTAPSSPGTGKLRIAAETGSPDKLVVVNELGQIQRVGVQTWTVTIGVLAADNTTRYFVPFGSSVTPDSSEANVDTFIAPAALHVWAMACGGSTAPGSGKSRTFTLRGGAQGALSASTISCAWTDTGKSCTSRGSSEAGFAVAAAAAVTISAAAAGTPTATVAGESTCVAYWTLDGF